MSDASIALPVAYRLERYEIMRVLGFGGFGITYLAQGLAQGADEADRVAIKEYFPNEIAVRGEDGTVRPRAEGDRDVFDWGLKRFVREAETIARFNHPNIVHVRRFFSANGTAYMVMSYEEGVSLGEIVERHGALDPSEIFEILAPLLDGLEKVHAAGVLHRDIKPDNIYLRSDGSPILLDFGAARLALGRRSISIHQVFTPGFAPPEQYQAEGDQGPWTDVYGMAAVLYSLVSGRAPVEAPRRTGALLRGGEDPLEPAAELGRGSYPRAFLEAIDWGLAVREADRPQSAGAWRDALFADELPDQPASRVETLVIAGRVQEDAQDPRASEEVPTRLQPAEGGRGGRLFWYAGAGVAIVAVGVAIGAFLAGDGGPRSAAAPTAKPAPTLLTVAPSDSGVSDLARVLENAPDGAILQLRPGRYAGGFVLSRGIVVRGREGEPGAVTIVSRDGPCVVLRGAGGLRDLTLVSLGLGGTRGCVRVESGSPEIVGNRIRNRGGPGIVVVGGSPTITDNLVARNGAQGMIFRGTAATPRAERNALIGNAASGLRVEDGAGGYVAGNRIMQNRHHGIWVRNGRTLTISGNQVYDNHGLGLVLDRKSSADVTGNTLLGNRSGQVRRHVDAQGRFERNLTK